MAKPLMVYDVQKDAMRHATQEDIDLLQRRCLELARFRDQVRVDHRIAASVRAEVRPNG